MSETWSNGDGRQFRIVEEIILDGQHWIHYQRVDRPDLAYSCLAAAFYHRFVRGSA